MRVHDVMSKAVTTIDADVDVAAARDKLKETSAKRLVVMRNAHVVGVVSPEDLTQADDAAPLRDFMKGNVATIAPGATLRRAAGIMRGRVVDWLLVVEGAKPIGFVSSGDLLESLAKGEVHAAPPTDRVILRKRGPRKRAMPI